MKGKLVTGIVVLAVIGGIIGINSLEPQRKSREMREEQMNAQKAIEEIEEIENSEKDKQFSLTLSEIVSEQIDKGEENFAEMESNQGDYRVVFECSNGTFTVQVDASLAPLGAAQFKKALKDDVYKDARFFRVIDGFVAQFGIPANPAKAEKWEKRKIQDDPVVASNLRGTITFATSGPNSRTTQLFINFADNVNLDAMGFAPFGTVIDGMDVVDSIYSGHGQNPDQGAIRRSGNKYLENAYPELDYIISTTIIEPEVVDDVEDVDAAEEEGDDASEEDAERDEDAA
jgi:peptidyl-prolyl cis-trans isomerase A (cyclophilin A)